jgi:hypothetical protein
MAGQLFVQNKSSKQIVSNRPSAADRQIKLSSGQIVQAGLSSPSCQVIHCVLRSVGRWLLIKFFFVRFLGHSRTLAPGHRVTLLASLLQSARFYGIDPVRD